MAASVSASDMLPKLEQVRQACLADASQYISVVPGVVPILQNAAGQVDVRRWGADFVAEAFATPALHGHQKEQMITDTVMALICSMLETPNEDTAVVKSAVQAAACMYPHVFRRVISHPELALVWRDMVTIKVKILQRMDSAPLPVHVCCIKFLQKVVQVQTPGVIADPRRPEQNETSIALVPRNHPLLIIPNIEAETSAILDRLLSVIQENSIDPLLVDPTMNCLAVLLKTRPAIQTKILTTILNYNPLRAAGGAMTTRLIIIIKSLTRTTRALLRYVMKIMPQHPLMEKVDAYLRRLQTSTTAVFTQAQSLKRSASFSQGPEDLKRQKVEPERKFPPMPRPPISFAQLFTLIDNQEFQQFDVKMLPGEVVSLISSALLQHIDSKTLDEAVEEVQVRLETLKELDKSTVALDDDDDYDPEALGGTDAEASTALQLGEDTLPPPTLELGPFELPKPLPMSDAELAMLSEQTIAHVFEQALTAPPSAALTKQKSGINRLAGNANDKDSWMTVMIRLATRAPAGLDGLVDETLNGEHEPVKTEGNQISRPHFAPDRIRQQLFDYIIDDWKHRLTLGLTWLTEEWYADKVQTVGLLSATTNGSTNTISPTIKSSGTTPNYTNWTLRLFETLLPRFDSSDHRLLIRFLSELPSLNPQILSQIKILTRDPATVDICKKAMQYLYLMRPPVRELVVDTMEEIWREGDDEVKVTMGQLLAKWRPGFDSVENKVEEMKEQVEETRTWPNGVKGEDVAADQRGE